MLIEEKVAKLLIDKNKTLSIGESCTGGLLSNRLTNIPGCSEFLKGGVIAYSNETKIKLLKVSQAILKKYGAVHTDIALAMAQGARKTFNSDFGIGITGIAGPTGGTKKKPVGLTFIAVVTNREMLCIECLFKGTRISIKSHAATQALKLLLEFLT